MACAEDPRTYDWSQIANATRGVLEYLVESRRTARLAAFFWTSMGANEECKRLYADTSAKARHLHNGEPLQQPRTWPPHFRGWCEQVDRLKGNSMAARMGALVDGDTGQAREGGIEVVDDYTVRITFPSSDITLVAGIADYPAAIQHRNLIGTNPLDHGIGTGAYSIAEYEVGIQARLVKERRSRLLGRGLSRRGRLRRFRHRPGPHGSPPPKPANATCSTRTVGEFIDLFDAIGWERSEVTTGRRWWCARTRTNAPYDNRERASRDAHGRRSGRGAGAWQ